MEDDAYLRTSSRSLLRLLYGRHVRRLSFAFSLFSPFTMTELLARLPDLTDFQAKLPLEEQREILTLAATLHQWLVVPDLQAVKEQIPPAIRSLKEQILTRCGVEHQQFAEYLNRSAMCAITGRSNPCFTRQFSSDTPTTLELYLSGLHVALLEYLLCHWQGSTNQTLETIPALAILLA